MFSFLDRPISAFTKHPRLVLTSIALLLLVQVSTYWIPTDDGAHYLSIARSLGTGAGLLRFGQPHLYYAPGYPISIAPTFTFSNQPFLLISLMHWVFLIILMSCTYKWVQSLTKNYALLITLLTVLNVAVLYYFRRTLSEALFMPVLMAAVLALNRSINNQPNRTAYLILGTLLTCYLCLIRLAGISIVAGCVLLLACKVHRRSIKLKHAFILVAVIAIPATACVVSNLAYEQHTSRAIQTATYANRLLENHSSFASVLLNNLLLRIQECGRLLIPGMFKAYGGWSNPAMLLYIPLCLILILGWRRLLSSHADVLICTLPFYLSIYMVWPFDQGARFMTPMVPVLFAAVWIFVQHSRLRPYGRQLFAVLLLLGTLTSGAYWAIDFAHARRIENHWPAVEKIAAAIGDGNPVVGCHKLPQETRAMLVFSLDRPVWHLPPEQTDMTKWDYIVVGPSIDKLAGFRRIAQANDLTVYKRR